jgi:hypothetical protein
MVLVAGRCLAQDSLTAQECPLRERRPEFDTDVPRLEERVLTQIKLFASKAVAVVLSLVCILALLPRVTALAITGTVSATPVRSFDRMATYDVTDEVAEIIASTPDGKTVIHTDSASDEIGFVDITDPKHPTGTRLLAMPGEPTSVAVTPDGAWALVAVDSSSQDALVVVDLANRTISTTVDLQEGEFVGGHDFTVFSNTGEVLFEPGTALELEAVRHGRYPDDRSEDKGVEPEGVTVAVYQDRTFLFVGSERGNFVAVYRLDDETQPEFVQLLPTGAGPEGLLPIPQRGLFVTANEEDATISIFQGRPGRVPTSYPQVVSDGLPWSVLSGLAAG